MSWTVKINITWKCNKFTEKTSRKIIDKTNFIFETELDDLPEVFEVEYLNNYLSIDKLNCRGKECRGVEDCWCDFEEGLDGKGEAEEDFLLIGTQRNYIMTVKGVLIENDVQFSLSFQQVYPEDGNQEKAETKAETKTETKAKKPGMQVLDTVTEHSKIILNFLMESPDEEPCEAKMGSNHLFYNAEFPLQVHLDYLPDFFKVNCEQSLYTVKDLNCNIEESCCHDSENSCWCALLTNIDKTGQYRHEINLNQIIGYYEMNYKLKIHAILNPAYPDWATLLISFDSVFKKRELDGSYLKFREQTSDDGDFKETTLEIDWNPLYKTTLQIDFPDKLPNYFELFTKGWNYHTHPLGCDTAGCPTQIPCWCRLYEQLGDNSKVGQMRVPLLSEYDFESYWLLIFAQKDRKNRQILHVTFRVADQHKGSAIHNSSIWVPPGQEKNPHRRFLYFDPEG